jgi:hypothetical protein
MFTTAGSTLLTIDANELDAGIGSGTVSGVALVPANIPDFIAETRPDTTEPINMPTASVKATNTVASIFRRLAQVNNSLTCSPMSLLLSFWHRGSVRSQRATVCPPYIITPLFPWGCHLIALQRVNHWPSGRGALRFLFTPYWTQETLNLLSIARCFISTLA